jgi:hypothetical protein
MRKLLLCGAALALLAGCGSDSLKTAQTVASLAVPAVQAACADAMGAAQVAGTTVKGGAANTVSQISTYVVAGCATAQAIAALARDSSSIAWLAKNQGTLEGLTAAQSAAKPAS